MQEFFTPNKFGRLLDYDESPLSGSEQVREPIQSSDSLYESSSSNGAIAVCVTIKSSSYSEGGEATTDATMSGNSNFIVPFVKFVSSQSSSVSISIVFGTASSSFSSPVSIVPCLDSNTVVSESVHCHTRSQLQGVDCNEEGVMGWRGVWMVTLYVQ